VTSLHLLLAGIRCLPRILRKLVCGDGEWIEDDVDERVKRFEESEDAVRWT